LWQAQGVSTVETLVGFFADRRAPVAPPVPAEPDLTDEQHALVDQGCRRSGVIWVRPFDDGRLRPAWHHWDGAAVLLVSGPGEQSLPGLTGLVEVVVPNKVTGARLVTFAARAEHLSPDTAPWHEAATALSAVRLNGPGPTAQVAAWAGTCLVTRLVPLTVLSSGAGGTAEPSGAAAAPPNPGTTVTRRPWHLGGRGRRAARHSAPEDSES
jgi:hypothetical protein